MSAQQFQAYVVVECVIMYLVHSFVIAHRDRNLHLMAVLVKVGQTLVILEPFELCCFLTESLIGLFYVTFIWTTNKSNSCILTLKEPGYFDPSHSRRGAAPPLKISETDRWNIKCVVLVDSYDPPESIGTKKIQNIPCMTSQWRYKWGHVKNTKITKNCQNHGFSLFFQAKVAFFSNDVCQSMLTHVLTPNKPNK